VIGARLRRARRQLGRILRTRYPTFLFTGRQAPGERFAFVYHDVDPARFRADLSFLATNGYRTVGVEEFVLAPRSSGIDRRVLLTFDDARRNFREVAFPILVEFGARATLFVPTLWIDGQGATAGGMFMSWDEIHECEKSGLVDVESHAHRHALMYTGDRVAAWTTPDALATYDIYEWPLRLRDDAELLGPPPLGTPIYESEPLLSAQHGMMDRGDVVGACQELVTSAGGERFFDDPEWRSLLADRHREVLAERSAVVRLDDDMFRQLVESEFQRSRELFEQQLGRPPRFMAYPWMLGSQLSLDAALENGIEAVFGVGLDFRRAGRPGGRLAEFGRLKGDWLRSLPGSGRQSLASVMADKLKRLTQPEHLSH
jgi:peptidoglycan/xylan/chitin deacetylase (PgdA/CDA1 family)